MCHSDNSFKENGLDGEKGTLVIGKVMSPKEF